MMDGPIPTQWWIYVNGEFHASWLVREDAERHAADLERHHFTVALYRVDHIQLPIPND